jgi:ABC-type nitrate/sulfonate/bicarbonate transport system substrate-binding protein
MNRGFSRRNFLSAAGFAALAVPLVACAATSSAGGATQGKVRLTYGSISVPKSRGVLEKTLKDHGITVEWVGPFPNHAPSMQAVVGGSADFSFGQHHVGGPGYPLRLRSGVHGGRPRNPAPPRSSHEPGRALSASPIWSATRSR